MHDGIQKNLSCLSVTAGTGSPPAQGSESIFIQEAASNQDQNPYPDLLLAPTAPRVKLLTP